MTDLDNYRSMEKFIHIPGKLKTRRGRTHACTLSHAGTHARTHARSHTHTHTHTHMERQRDKNIYAGEQGGTTTYSYVPYILGD